MQEKTYEPIYNGIDSITIGADPEMFVSKNGVFVPAEVTGVSGTKKSPQALPGGGAVQIDGLALEFNILPAKTADDFVTKIQSTLEEVRAVVDRGLSFNFIPSVTFGTEEFASVSEDNRKLGCDPDYSAWTMKEKTPTGGAEDRPFRTAAGHIHVGFTKDADPHDPRHIYDCAMIAQWLDVEVGAYEGCWAPESDRRTLYGEFGSFRPKSYGLEYRVLGNDWLSKPNVMKFIFEKTRRVVDDLLRGRRSYPVYPSADRVSRYTDAYYMLSNHRGSSVNGSIKNALKSAFLNDELITRYKSDCEYYVNGSYYR